MITPGDLLVFKGLTAGNLWELYPDGRGRRVLHKFKQDDVVLIIGIECHEYPNRDPIMDRQAQVLSDGTFGTILFIDKFEKVNS